MSTDILRSYEQQFGILCADITSKISKSINSKDQASSITNIETLFQDAREIIEQMELEIRDINSAENRSPEQKQKCLNIINGYTSELKKLENEFNSQIKLKRNMNNNFAIEINENGRDASELNQINNENEEKLNRMGSKLESGYRTILETEETGTNILKDLFSQREVAERARDRLRNVNANLGKSSRVVGAMSRRLMQNKALLFGLCVSLIVFIIFIIYIAIRK
jgi:vesicle transport through interaction with t-SNAREs 1